MNRSLIGLSTLPNHVGVRTCSRKAKAGTSIVGSGEKLSSGSSADFSKVATNLHRVL